MDLTSIKKEVDECIKISNDKKITPLNSEGLIKITPQEFLELTEKQNLIHTDNLESKIEYIYKVSLNLFILYIYNIVGWYYFCVFLAYKSWTGFTDFGQLTNSTGIIHLIYYLFNFYYILIKQL